jgi:hypothetical protein
MQHVMKQCSAPSQNGGKLWYGWLPVFYLRCTTWLSRKERTNEPFSEEGIQFTFLISGSASVNLRLQVLEESTNLTFQ